MSRCERWRRAGWLRAVDAALADALRRHAPGVDETVLLAAALASRALADGHVALDLRAAGALLDADEAATLPAADDWAAALRDETRLVGTDADSAAPLVLDGGLLYLRRFHRYEIALAAALLARAGRDGDGAGAGTGAADADAGTDAATTAWREARLQALFPLLATDPGDAQAEFARQLPQRRLLLLSGGPGTGKTSSVARALVLLVEQALRMGRPLPRIALAAPTGKAAARLAESLRENLAQLRDAGLLDDAVAAALPTQASTLHRLLGWRPGGAGFRHDATAPLPADVVIVDEASMVDLPLMARLLAAVPPDARLVLIGDPDQLPSVDAGDVLGAMCDARGALPRIALTRVHRQAGDSAIAVLAAALRDGDADAAVATLRAGDEAAAPATAAADLRWIEGGDRGLPAAALAAARAAWGDGLATATPTQALQLARRFRVLTAVRDGAAGSEALNAHLQQALAPPAWRGQRAFPGLLLMITANSPRHGLFNGDVGVVLADADGGLRVWFDDEDGPRAWLLSALPAHEPAFALTVHKAQGSEFERVLLALPEHGARVLSRELLYTGLTRARATVTLWSREDVLRSAIARVAVRWSGLAARLRPAPPRDA